MTAEMNEDGVLIVTAETSLESFALSLWWEDWNEQDFNNKDGFAALKIVSTPADLP